MSSAYAAYVAPEDEYVLTGEELESERYFGLTCETNDDLRRAELAFAEAHRTNMLMFVGCDPDDSESSVTALPSDLAEIFPDLKVLDISHTNIRVLPKLPPKLAELSCISTPLESLPEDLPRTLKHLDASASKLTRLPNSVRELSDAYVNVGQNPLDKSWLASLGVTEEDSKPTIAQAIMRKLRAEGPRPREPSPTAAKE